MIVPKIKEVHVYVVSGKYVDFKVKRQGNCLLIDSVSQLKSKTNRAELEGWELVWKLKESYRTASFPRVLGKCSRIAGSPLEPKV